MLVSIIPGMLDGSLSVAHFQSTYVCEAPVNGLDTVNGHLDWGQIEAVTVHTNIKTRMKR